jgi:hypothetical protein
MRLTDSVKMRKHNRRKGDNDMKRSLIVLGLVLVMGFTVCWGAAKMGWGKTVSITSPATYYACPMATYLSVYNAGTSTIYCLVNSTTNQFTGIYAAGETVPIPASQSFTFNAQNNREIESIIIGTSTNALTNLVYLAGY